MRYKLTQAAGHVQPLAARCISKWAIAALVTTDSLAQLSKALISVHEVTGSNLVADKLTYTFYFQIRNLVL